MSSGQSFLQATSAARSILRQSANLVSASRILLACIWIAVFFGHHPQSSVLCAVAFGGAASDLLDGRIARRTHSASQFGRWLDSTADIVFVLAALSCEAYGGAIPAYIPALVAASFAQYALDSVLIRGAAVPVKSRLGHWAGILNYIIVLLLASAPPPQFPGTLLRSLAPLIGLWYVAAMCERALYYPVVHRLQTLESLKPAAGE
jgi:phosphatidylglycerophosphate synthase